MLLFPGILLERSKVAEVIGVSVSFSATEWHWPACLFVDPSALTTLAKGAKAQGTGLHFLQVYPEHRGDVYHRAGMDSRESLEIPEISYRLLEEVQTSKRAVPSQRSLRSLLQF